MNVAIVGAGISGLLTAYLLKQKQPDTAITIFEKSARVGGNAHTVNFEVGQPQSAAIPRWADLGVNDFNLTSYHNIARLFQSLGVAYQPLEDSTAFSTADGAIAYVIDPGYKAGDRTKTNMSLAVQKGFDNFAKQAPLDCLNPKFAAYSMAEYIQAKNAEIPDFYPDDFVNYNLYPRINGMYFVHDTVPSTMSFVGVMHYYMLQEGFGTLKPAERVYLTGGTQAWISALQNQLLAKGTKISVNNSVVISGGTSGAKPVIFSNTNGLSYTFDAVVVATHAATALKLINYGITNDMTSVLSQFDYYNSIAIAHTYAPVLPPDRNTWRTYNILIHSNQARLRPYTISYVCNRHQNDAQSLSYNYFGGPEFFVTLDPAIPIPEAFVLTQSDGTPAIANFTHNIVSVETIAAQKRLWAPASPQGPSIQGQNGLFFTGGWTLGAGLHEECYQSANQVSNLILDLPLNEDILYTPEAASDCYAPSYVRSAVSMA